MRGVGANRYWERRWRDAAKKIGELEFRLLASEDVHEIIIEIAEDIP